MPESVLIFANPIAGRGKGRIIAAQLASRLARAGYKCWLILQRADEVADSAIPPDMRCAIAIGGDGTVRGVVSRLMKCPGKLTPPVLVVPMGTANLLGKHLGTRWNNRQRADNVASAVAELKTVELDLASANGELFLLIAGVGLDASIVHELDRIRSGPIGYASYALPAAMAFGRYAYPPLTVTVDDQVIAKNLPAVAFVGNVPEYGTGFPILPFARPDDGLLDVCVLPCAGRIDAIRQFMRAVTGAHVDAEGTVYTRGTRIRIESAEPAPIQLDGEAAGHTPLQIELLPQKVRFIVPAV
jgi:YegS/Rv2252/BmrU family lipid kinase